MIMQIITLGVDFDNGMNVYVKAIAGFFNTKLFLY